MTPVSSILEACNAGELSSKLMSIELLNERSLPPPPFFFFCSKGHSNPEPLYVRWIRGIIPRGLREVPFSLNSFVFVFVVLSIIYFILNIEQVIFGVGLNQLSDYCEERIPPYIENTALRNAAGSLTAGIISGYLSSSSSSS